jgi:hypothetical protein
MKLKHLPSGCRNAVARDEKTVKDERKFEPPAGLPAYEIQIKD